MGATASKYIKTGISPFVSQPTESSEKIPQFPSSEFSVYFEGNEDRAEADVLAMEKRKADRFISILRDAVLRHEWLCEEDVRSIPACPQGDTMDDRCRRFMHLSKIAILSMSLVADFAKDVPGFQLLTMEDQITLLEARAEELLLIHFSSKYYLGVDSVRLLPNETFYSRSLLRDTYRSAATVDRMFDFFRRVAYLGMDDAEYALLQAVLVFSDCPNLQDSIQVKKLRNRYLCLLCNYSSKKRSSPSALMLALIPVRRDLRALAGSVNELFFSFRITMEDVVSVLHTTGRW